jgi:hypothetical protein
LTHHLIIGQFHHIIKVTLLIIPTNMQHIDQSFVPARNCLVMSDAIQLSMVGPRIFEERPLHNLHCPPGAKHALGQPYLPIAAPGDLDHQLIIRDVK